MRLTRRVTTFLVLLCVLVGLTQAAFADGQYSVWIFAGNQGTINGQSVAVVKSFSTSDVVIREEVSDKYYVKGIRESGRGSGTIYTELPDITRDQDYVVVYGLKVNAVTLTINYQDANGNTLSASRTYLGNAGDKPQVKAAYVDGYTPSYRYITGTLSGDTTWTFVYNRNVVPAPAPADDNGNNNGNNNGDNTDGDVNNGDNANTPNGETAENPGSTEENSQTTNSETVDILDMDTPLAEPDRPQATKTPESSESAAPIPKAAIVALVILLAALIAVLYWYLLFYRKKRIREKKGL